LLLKLPTCSRLGGGLALLSLGLVLDDWLIILGRRFLLLSLLLLKK
jgi:hypothetical protein